MLREPQRDQQSPGESKRAPESQTKGAQSTQESAEHPKRAGQQNPLANPRKAN